MSDQPHARVRTASGHLVDLLDPDPATIDVLDIAHALSRQCRYNGHCPDFFSVAEHCVLVSTSTDTDHALAGLLHDAAETYVGDVVTPLKHQLPDYRRIEDRIEAAIAEHFNLDPALLVDGHVKQADIAALDLEQAVLFGDRRVTAGQRAQIHCWPADQARSAWLRRFTELTGTSFDALVPDLSDGEAALLDVITDTPRGHTESHPAPHLSWWQVTGHLLENWNRTRTPHRDESVTSQLLVDRGLMARPLIEGQTHIIRPTLRGRIALQHHRDRTGAPTPVRGTRSAGIDWALLVPPNSG